MFRKIAIGTWKTAYDPSVYGTLHLPMDKAADYIQRFRSHTGKKLTVSHLMAKAIAACFVRMPDANSILRFNRVYQRKTIGVFFQVAMTDEGEDKIDLSGATIVVFGSTGWPKVASMLEKKGLSACLSLPGDILVVLEGKRVLIKRP